ncbi:MAG: DUF58 domain-containing protein [Dehalococcoidia bacterium]|nr:DUF58 domain-containing protein [Dehalococcoidia bacterium]
MVAATASGGAAPPAPTLGDGALDAGLPPQLAAQIRRIEIRARRLASTLLAGDYRSVFRGAGIEFAEAREYTMGDDVRLIDWNVTARMGTPWVKRYVEERELSVVCAVDLSASQLAARPASGRLGVAAEVLALLSFAAAFNNDRAGLLTFSDRVERFVPPARGPRHVLRLVREVLLHPPPHPGTSIAAAADYLGRVLRRRSIVFLITDGFDRGFEQALRALTRRHEVVAITLVDPLDLALPALGLVELEDAERGERLLLDSADRRVRRRYAQAAQARTEARRATLLATGVDEIELRLDRDYVEPLLRYFRRRAARR